MTSLPPHLAASVDQWRAILRDLTNHVADHKKICDLAECVGMDMHDWLKEHTLELPALMSMCLIDRAAPVPDRLDVECAVVEALDQCKAERLLSFVRSEGDDFGQGLFSTRTDAVAVLAALDRIGALRSRP